MKQEKELASTTKEKKKKSNKTIDAFIIGLLIGVAVFSAVRNGLGFFTIFPLILAYFFFKKKKGAKENNG